MLSLHPQFNQGIKMAPIPFNLFQREDPCVDYVLYKIALFLF